MSVFNKKYNELTLEELKSEYLSDSFNKKLQTHIDFDFRLALSQEKFTEHASQILGKVVSDKFKIINKKHVNTKVDRILNLILSDIHYGANLNPAENLCWYTTTEEARRTASIVNQVIDYKPQYREHSKLYVHLLGDIIQNKLHDPLDGEFLSEQCSKAIFYLTQALEHFSSNFPAGVKVFCSTGNHGRIKSRHPDRAVNQKWDSFETIIYYALKNAFKNDKNIEFYIPKTQFYSVKIFNKFAYFAHGDTGVKAPFPNGNINVAKISNQINKVNASRIDGQMFDVFCFGHVHTAAIIDLGNGILVTNGALVPPDSYAHSQAIYKCRTGQQLFESVMDHAVGDRRFLEVNAETDLDESLDRIILPFSGF